MNQFIPSVVSIPVPARLSSLASFAEPRPEMSAVAEFLGRHSATIGAISVLLTVAALTLAYLQGRQLSAQSRRLEEQQRKNEEIAGSIKKAGTSLEEVVQNLDEVGESQKIQAENQARAATTIERQVQVVEGLSVTLEEDAESLQDILDKTKEMRTRIDSTENALAMLQTLSKRVSANVRRVQEDVGTQYVGGFPRYLSTVAELVASAKSSVFVLGDGIANGHFSAHPNFSGYWQGLLTARGNGAKIFAGLFDREAWFSKVGPLFNDAEITDYVTNASFESYWDNSLLDGQGLGLKPRDEIDSTSELRERLWTEEDGYRRLAGITKLDLLSFGTPISCWIVDNRKAVFALHTSRHELPGASPNGQATKEVDGSANGPGQREYGDLLLEFAFRTGSPEFVNSIARICRTYAPTAWDAYYDHVSP